MASSSMVVSPSQPGNRTSLSSVTYMGFLYVGDSCGRVEAFPFVCFLPGRPEEVPGANACHGELDLRPVAPRKHAEELRAPAHHRRFDLTIGRFLRPKGFDLGGGVRRNVEQRDRARRLDSQNGTHPRK